VGALRRGRLLRRHRPAQSAGILRCGLDTFVGEQRASAGLIGLDRAAAPASMAELDACYEPIRPRLYACEEAKQALWLTLYPPVPDGNRVLKLGPRVLPRLATWTGRECRAAAMSSANGTGQESTSASVQRKQ
jgi:hypothetical protein